MKASGPRDQGAVGALCIAITPPARGPFLSSRPPNFKGFKGSTARVGFTNEHTGDSPPAPTLRPPRTCRNPQRGQLLGTLAGTSPPTGQSPWGCRKAAP